MTYAIIAIISVLAISVVGELWLCLHMGKEDEAELAKRERNTENQEET